MDVLDMLGRNIHLSRHYSPSAVIQKLEFSLPAWSSCLESLQTRAGKSELPLKDVVMTTPRADAGTCPCDMMPEAQRDAKFLKKDLPQPCLLMPTSREEELLFHNEGPPILREWNALSSYWMSYLGAGSQETRCVTPQKEKDAPRKGGCKAKGWGPPKPHLPHVSQVLFMIMIKDGSKDFQNKSQLSELLED